MIKNNFIFFIFFSIVLHLSHFFAGPNKITTDFFVNVDTDVLKFEIGGNCQNFTMCYKSALFGPQLPWKVGKRFRFGTDWSTAALNGAECAKNERQIQFSIADRKMTFGTETFELKYTARNWQNSTLKLKFHHKISNKILSINNVQQKSSNLSQEFFAHSNLGSFLADYAWFWLLAADIVPKNGHSSTKLTFVVPEGCRLNVVEVPPHKCVTFNGTPIQSHPQKGQHHRHHRSINPLIHGGKPMDISHIPWAVYFEYDYLKWKNGSVGVLTGSCTGSLISNKFVLLAAHCLRNANEGTKLYLGFNSSSREWSSKHWKGIKAKVIRKSNSNVFIHPKFNKTDNKGSYDLALIKLHHAIPFTIPPICLHCANVDQFRSGRAHIAGWGKTTDLCLPPQHITNATLSSTLRPPLMGKNVSLVKCPAKFGDGANRICTEGKSAQQGDSGGALLASPNGSTHFLQVGVLSKALCTGTLRGGALYALLDGCWIEKITGVRCGN